ncbi:MAG: hypothetical protein ACRC8S_19285 [Fimbriiglobus sp.]
MIRIALLIGCTFLLAVPASAAAPTKKEVRSIYKDGDKATRTLDKLCTSSLTGKSPWLVMGAGGAIQYFKTNEADRSQLGYFAQPYVFGPILLLVLLVIFKDTLLTWASVLKAPLNALAEFMHMAGGGLAFLYLGELASEFAGPSAGAEFARLADNTISDASPPPSGSNVYATLVFLMMSCIHLAVWIVFNSVEVAIILNPFPFVDTLLKAGRTAVIGAITGAAEIHPILGFLLAAPIILGCIILIPTALRLTILGWVYSRDGLMRLFVAPDLSGPTRGFASWHLPGVRMLTYGRVERTEAGWEFVYKRLFLAWTRRVPLPSEGLAIGIGILNPGLLVGEEKRSLVRFSPKYTGREQELAQKLGVDKIIDGSLTASFKQLLRRIRETFWAKTPATT